ncbi:restriction endonuclease subunit S [Streptomyces sp. NBC_01732]|uniref:restriction endonuclease subunit S n=1 Tax=unclassified Streptomyces TaxID=2593676 RepID=UPI0013DE0C5C|nr:restriction endonuclease subunit S [Streptomyces sp. ADI95-17]WSG50939.1 restriction endonuclease subunit S [Streptomyces sp. NBC_01732]
MGKQLSPASREAAGQFPYLRVANVYEGRIDVSNVKSMGFSSAERELYGLRPGDILLNEGQENLRMVGRSALYSGTPGAYCFQNTLIRFRPGPKVLPEYAQAVFVRWRSLGVFAGIAEKTSISHLGGSRFGSLLFPCRPLREQQRIVELTEAVSAQERAIEMSIAKLRSVRRGVLLSAMATIRAGEPPAGWSRVPLKDVVPKAEYGISEALDGDQRGVPVLRMNNLDNGRPELSDLKYSPVPVPGRLELRNGDVLFNRTNSIDHIGKSGIWREELPRATFASYLVRINPDETRLIPEYLVEWLMHPSIRQRVRSISTVAVQQVNVNPTRLRELEIDMPVDLADQRRIVDSLHSCDEQIESERVELAKVRALKLGLVDDLLTIHA